MLLRYTQVEDNLFCWTIETSPYFLYFFIFFPLEILAAFHIIMVLIFIEWISECLGHCIALKVFTERRNWTWVATCHKLGSRILKKMRAREKAKWASEFFVLCFPISSDVNKQPHTPAYMSSLLLFLQPWAEASFPSWTCFLAVICSQQWAS